MALHPISLPPFYSLPLQFLIFAINTTLQGRILESKMQQAAKLHLGAVKKKELSTQISNLELADSMYARKREHRKTADNLFNGRPSRNKAKCGLVASRAPHGGYERKQGSLTMETIVRNFVLFCLFYNSELLACNESRKI